MKNKNVKGILALAVVTALSFGVILGSKAIAGDISGEAGGETAAETLEELDVAGAEGIEKAVKTADGYLVTARAKGYGGDIVLNASFADDAKTLTKVEILEQTETEGVGSLITEADFLSQFEGVEAPVYLPGMNVSGEEKKEAAPARDLQMQDGTYTAKTAEADQNGFIDEVTITVADGKITEAVWDCITEDGARKSVMSENGEYTMTEDGPTWKAQAEALADALVKEQDLNFFAMDEQGKTDAVSGVSISIGGFVSLAEDCMKQAAGIKSAPLTLQDGTYTAKTTEADQNGFIDEVTITVADGKITEAVWDCITEDGARKSVMSENGEYTMTEDGPTWKAQAEALADTLIKEQSLDVFAMDEQGKTDAVSGVSISIGGFVSLAEDCMKQAAGVTEEAAEAENATKAMPQDGTQADAVSGATISSTAAVTAINQAYTFLQTAK